MFSKRLVLCFIFSVFFFTASSFSGEIDKLKPEGKAFFHYLFDLSKPEEGASWTDNKQEFALKRVYLGIKYTLSDNFMARVLFDAAYNNRLDVFVKYAYLQWKVKPIKSKLLIGLQGTNNWKQPEKAWGYRGIRFAPMESFGSYWGGVKGSYNDALTKAAETLLDTSGGNIPSASDISKAAQYTTDAANFKTAANTKMGSSADLGIGFKIKPNDATYINFLVRNGIGYKKAENDFYKNIQLRSGFFLLEKAIHFSAYAEVEPWKGVDEKGEDKTFANVQWDALLDFDVKDIFSLGFNVNSKVFSGNNENVIGVCFGVFGDVHLVKKKLKALARFDMYSTGLNDTEVLKDAETNANLIIAGFDFKPHKNVSIIPNIQIWTYEDRDKDTKPELFIHVIFKF